MHYNKIQKVSRVESFSDILNSDNVNVDCRDGGGLYQRDGSLYFNEYWSREVRQYRRWKSSECLVKSSEKQPKKALNGSGGECEASQELGVHYLYMNTQVWYLFTLKMDWSLYLLNLCPSIVPVPPRGVVWGGAVAVEAFPQTQGGAELRSGLLLLHARLVPLRLRRPTAPPSARSVRSVIRKLSCSAALCLILYVEKDSKNTCVSCHL